MVGCKHEFLSGTMADGKCVKSISRYKRNHCSEKRRNGPELNRSGPNDLFATEQSPLEKPSRLSFLLLLRLAMLLLMALSIATNVKK
jgi:hypothetical protein